MENLPLEVAGDKLRRAFIAFGQMVSVNVGNGNCGAMALRSEGAVVVTVLDARTIRGLVIESIETLPLSDNNGNRSFHSGRSGRFNGRG